MDEEESNPESGEPSSRAPQREDLIDLCSELNARSARYVVVGGFAVIYAGYPRTTGDIDLLIETTPENEEAVFAALATLPDKCVRELKPGDVASYTVVRVADEYVVDLMASASGIDYAEASKSVVIGELDGVPIPFASAELLWRMKSRTHREKDAPDLQFLREYLLGNPPQS